MPPDAPTELRTLAERTRTLEARGADPAFADTVDTLEKAAVQIGRAWSGSSLGFHARVYYAELEPPPPGEHFSSEWGFKGMFQGTTGDWREHIHDEVVTVIRELAGSPDLGGVESMAEQARAVAKSARADVISILSAYLARRADAHLDGLRAEAEKLRALSKSEAMRAQLPSGQLMSRDTTALLQGPTVAPHQEVLAEVVSLRSPFTMCGRIADVAERAAAHIERLEAERRRSQTAPSGERVFIGHGQSPAWRELKDFISERLHLPWDEFNRVPIAGATNIARLSEMLNHAGIAFLVLTAEDETADGTGRARQNVVHEAGLFQGHLGFARAIVLLEEGCEEFSNIQGLGQIRFPRGRIGAAFEEVRAVLERERFLEPQ